jgi:hypothetical protein
MGEETVAKRVLLLFVFMSLFFCRVNAFPIETTLDSWIKYTIPTNHYVNIAQIPTPYGDGISVNTIGYPGAFEYGYDFLGYYNEKFTVPLSGTIEIEGYFMYNDVTPHPERKYLSLYLLRSDFSGYINETRLLDYSRGDEPGVWYYRHAIIYNLTRGEEFRIAFGRNDLCDMDRMLEASWAAINVVPNRILRVPSQYSTIQEAITEASLGYTIEVAPGTYYEHIVVDKDDLKIVGEDSKTTIIDANIESGPNHAAVYITGKNVFFSEFTVRNCPDVSGITIHGENSTIIENRITNNTVGISLFGNDSKIVGNNICNNLQGVWIANNVENSKLYYSNFFNNTQHFYHQSPSQGVNSWDNGYAGNFWSNYTGADMSGDGIGDTPHILDSNDTDHYPLMNPYWVSADVNHDLKVDILDVVKICLSYGAKPSDLYWNPHADIAEPRGVIDILDVVACTSRYGEKYP